MNTLFERYLVSLLTIFHLVVLTLSRCVAQTVTLKIKKLNINNFVSISWDACAYYDAISKPSPVSLSTRFSIAEGKN